MKGKVVYNLFFFFVKVSAFKEDLPGIGATPFKNEWNVSNVAGLSKER